MLDSILTVGCPHNPKTVKKVGTLFGEICQVMVCDSCRHDPDLSKFKEEVL